MEQFSLVFRKSLFSYWPFKRQCCRRTRLREAEATTSLHVGSLPLRGTYSRSHFYSRSICSFKPTHKRLNFATHTPANSRYGPSQAQDNQEGCSYFINTEASLEETRLQCLWGKSCFHFQAVSVNNLLISTGSFLACRQERKDRYQASSMRRGRASRDRHPCETPQVHFDGNSANTPTVSCMGQHHRSPELRSSQASS